MLISLVVAVAENGVIGAHGDVPWRIPSDLRYFREVTMGKPVIMGRKTWEGIGRPLPGRDNIVVTRQADYEAAGVHVVHDVDSALAKARELAAARGGDEICVIGGEEIFRAAMDRADRIYLSRVHMTVEGDTFFPDDETREWQEVSREFHPAEPGDSADWTLVVLERRP